MSSAFQNFPSHGSRYYLPFHEPHILNDFVHQIHGLSQGVMGLTFLLHIRQTCLLHCMLTKAGHAGLTSRCPEPITAPTTE